MNIRAVLIVLDSLGAGALPDAGEYGDSGANTLGHIVEAVPDIRIPNLKQLGLANIKGAGLTPDIGPVTGSYGLLRELSTGKDTITGHWEIAGLLTETPFQTFTDGFPPDFIKRFEKAIGIGTLGNYAASGTVIIKELGPEHAATGKPIVYTSADSVFQIAADTDVVPLETLYRYCLIAREMLTGDLQVGRVIARPFILRNGEYIRTADRRDYAVSPPAPTLLDNVAEGGMAVVAIGKIADIFNGQGITRAVHTDNNMDGVDKTIEAMRDDFAGLIFTNLVDFDSKYGHRRDPIGYAAAIEEFDLRLPEILGAMKEGDLLILCADHGNDPVHSGWNHTREHVPILVCGAPFKQGIDLGIRESFADIGATVAAYLNVAPTSIGASFLKEIAR